MKLIINSEYIVIASIDNPEKRDRHFDAIANDTIERFWIGGDGSADLIIKEILKGNLGKQQCITVNYEAGMICPAPADYPDKKIVIAFLGKEDTSSTYFTYGLSYGSKVMRSEAELNTYKARIIEFLDILKIKNKHKRKLAIVEWLVKCAEDKNTRWEGAYELSRRGDYMSYYDRSRDNKFYKAITATQIHRLDSAFFVTDTIGYSEMCLANLISRDNYPRLKQHLIKNLTISHYYLVTDIMKKIIEIEPNAKLQSIYDEAENISFDDKEKEVKQKQLIEKFMSEAERL